MLSGFRLIRWLGILTLLFATTSGLADGPDDNKPETVRPIPPPGIEISTGDRAQLSDRCRAVRANWATLNQKAKTDTQKSRLSDLECEVLVFPRAVEMALEFSQFYKQSDIAAALALLDTADDRIDVIVSGGDWAAVVGISDGSAQTLIVGGFRSDIDGSYQPYSAVIPRGLSQHDRRPRRLDLWFHGRGERVSEASFLASQQNNAGQYTPMDSIVLHPYGRYSNAFKFAGEIDVLESLTYLQSRLPVDESRISVRGFSMGGAGCWQMASHYADRWFAANPGAGFSETPEFLRTFQGEDVAGTAPEYQQRLWRLYDTPFWTTNLRQCPTIAYSGEIDRQKQAADLMAAALRKERMNLTHVIGPDTAHKIHADSKLEIESRMRELASRVSNQTPRRLSFATVSLRYHTMHWIDVRGLAQHWEPASVNASITDNFEIIGTTKNVTRLNLRFGPGQWPGPMYGSTKLTIDGTTLFTRAIRSDGSLEIDLVRIPDASSEGDAWRLDEAGDDEGLRKRPLLQGPIDDAFMDSFVFVLPSGKSKDAAAQRWYEAESEHAMKHWRIHFRGDVRSVMDTDLTDEIIASSNLILFGDADSNQVITRIAGDLPIRISEKEIAIGPDAHPRLGRVPVLIYPNPLNPQRYAVLNSGFTFREYDYLNNARQTPKLPDWAVVDVRSGATNQAPGVVESAGFFDESWKP